MSKPTLMRDRAENTQVALVVIVPLLFGAGVGIVLGVSAGFYSALLAVATVAALLSGLEHGEIQGLPRQRPGLPDRH